MTPKLKNDRQKALRQTKNRMKKLNMRFRGKDLKMRHLTGPYDITSLLRKVKLQTSPFIYFNRTCDFMRKIP